jgi:co-chaperonin GroES (HSP10)
MTMDITKLRPYGPWLLIRPEETTKVLDSGIYLPDGNLMERLGHSVGVVLAVGKGYLNPSRKAGTPKYTPVNIQKGDRVIFRGHLQEANRPGGVLDREHSIIHLKDILGVLVEGKLEPALPYDN